MEQTHLFLRFGIVLHANKDEIEKVIKGDGFALDRLIKDGCYEAAGDTYIPEISIEMYNADYGTNFEVGDVEFPW